MRFASIRLLGVPLLGLPLLGALMTTPAAAQGYYQPAPNGYVGRGDALSAARGDWHRARRAEDVARMRAANGDYEGANRAQYRADRLRQRARDNADYARGRR